MCDIIKKVFGSLGALAIVYAWLCGIALLFSILQQIPDSPIVKTIIETIIGTFVAAAAGTYGAQAIIEKTKVKDRLLEDLRQTNIAIMLVSDIFNTYYGLKKQHVKDLKETYDRQQEDLDKVFSQPRAPGGPIIFEYKEQFSDLPPIFVPTEQLLKQIFEKTSVGGRPMALTTTIIRTIEGLNGALQKLTDMKETIRAMPANTQEETQARMYKYLGRTDREGHVDSSCPDIIEAIFSYTDNCIEFSKTLTEDLMAHGEKLREKLGETAPKVYKVDFSAADPKLLPDSKDFKKWYDSFSKPSETHQS